MREGGRAWAHPLLVVSAAPNGLERTRAGLLVSRRVGNAVKRNRARRLLREAARRWLPHVRPGWDVVIIARSPLVESKLQSVEAALERMLRKGSLLGETTPQAREANA